MVMKFRLILLFLLLSASYNSFAQQLYQFSRQQEKFLEELSGLFNEVKKGTGKDFIEKEFGLVWFPTNAYTDQQQEIIYETFDMFLKNKNKVYPDIENYVKALIAFPKSGKTDKDFLEWQTVLTKMMADKKVRKYVPEFISYSVSYENDKCLTIMKNAFEVNNKSFKGTFWDFITFFSSRIL
jgi:hypothetical protein